MSIFSPNNAENPNQQTNSKYNNMDTETMTENRYVEALRKKRVKLTAKNLLHVMRPDVEDVLAKHGRLTPPSQSHRAQKLLAELRSAHPTESLRRMSLRFRDEDTLRYFLAVHKTVWILEGKPV